MPQVTATCCLARWLDVSRSGWPRSGGARGMVGMRRAGGEPLAVPCGGERTPPPPLEGLPVVPTDLGLKTWPGATLCIEGCSAALLPPAPSSGRPQGCGKLSIVPMSWGPPVAGVMHWSPRCGALAAPVCSFTVAAGPSLTSDFSRCQEACEVVGDPQGSILKSNLHKQSEEAPCSPSTF